MQGNVTMSGFPVGGRMPKKRWSTFLSFLIEVVLCMRILNTYVRNGHWLERMKKNIKN